MRQAAVIRIATWFLAAASIGACTPSSPVSNAPGAVRTALDPFVKAGYQCALPSGDQSAYLQWQCSTTSSQGVTYSVVVDANDAGLKNVLATVDQTRQHEATAAVAADFFSQVTDIDFGGSTQTVRDWVRSHLAGGGQEQVGPVWVTLDALQPVDHLNLFVRG